MIIDIPSHIEQKIYESIRRTSYQLTECNRLLSIGRIYHTVSLVIEDNPVQDTAVIYVLHYRPR